VVAVVDPLLRVLGADALSVIDLSITPTIVSGNTNAAAIMIGERGADLVRGRSASLDRSHPTATEGDRHGRRV
jgi:choline dehydrogenase